MAWRANQNQDLVVNNLTINGKLTYADPEDAGIVIPTDFTCEQLESVDKTNKIVMSTANEIDLDSTKVKTSNDLSVTGTADATYYHAKGKTNLLSQAKTQGSYLSWNETGQGQMDLICNKGTGIGGLNFYVQDTSGSVSDGSAPLFKIDATGDATMKGYCYSPYYLSSGKVNLLSQAKTQGTYISWDQTGAGETDIICNKGTGTGGFNFYIQDPSGSVSDTSTPLLKVNNSGMNLQGNLTVSGTVSSSNTSMQQEFHFAQVGGNGSSVSSTVNITGNGSTNYAVFPSVYYGYSGSSGTYNATDTSSAMNTIVISNITSTHFDFHVSKSTGDNVNVFIVFMVVFSSSLNYSKSY